MVNTVLFQVLFCLSVLGCSFTTMAQTSQIVPWSDGNLTATGRSVIAYHPEPIIFVHGITASRLVWKDVIQNLGSTNHWYDAYHYSRAAITNVYESSAPPDEGYSPSDPRALFVPSKELHQWDSIEQPYLHTFNYGRHAYFGPGTNLPPPGAFMLRQSRQSHDPVEWNSWQAPANDYLDSRKTLADRIDEIRDAYTMPNGDAPNVILIGHSLGGLVICDYLQRKNANPSPDPYVPVRRAVTVNTLLWGSPIANLLVNYSNLRKAGHGGMLWVNLLAPAITSGLGMMPPWNPNEWNNTAGTWIENHNTASRYLAMDLDDAVRRQNMPAIQTTNVLFRNSPFQSRLHSTPMPVTTEFVTSGSKIPFNPMNPFNRRNVVGKQLRSDLLVAFEGDGVVPLNSMAGYNGDGTPVFVNLSPVDIRGYTNGNSNSDWLTDHSTAPRKMGIYPHLLDGVQYKTGLHPDGTGTWSGLQKQYTNSPIQTASGVTFTHTDEPGIADLRQLYPRAGNPLLVPALNTWDTSVIPPVKRFTNATDFVTHQIVGANADPLVVLLGTAGTKNRSQNPVQLVGTNYWVFAGNEYLPAKLQVQCLPDAAPLPVVSNTTDFVALNTNLVSQCLVELDGNGDPQFQYGLFSTNITVASLGRFFMAAQAQNLAGLITPQAERAFDVPVVSSNVVAVLRKINEAEALSNACHTATEITRWVRAVNEWIVVPSNGVFELNFFPATDPTGGSILRDAWTGAVFTGWTYEITNKTVTVTNVDEAPSHLLATYTGYLGCAASFETNYDGNATNNFPVPALADNALAGLTVDTGWFTDLRARLENILPRYRNTTVNTNACIAWTLPSVLTAAGHTNTTWTPVLSNLVTAAHFDELRDVVALLTNQLDCCTPPTCVECNDCCFSFNSRTRMTIEVPDLNYLSEWDKWWLEWEGYTDLSAQTFIREGLLSNHCFDNYEPPFGPSWGNEGAYVTLLSDHSWHVGLLVGYDNLALVIGEYGSGATSPLVSSCCGAPRAQVPASLGYIGITVYATVEILNNKCCTCAGGGCTPTNNSTESECDGDGINTCTEAQDDNCEAGI
jgi:pimeloyl-ACP methyl ester carboxylesterase